MQPIQCFWTEPTMRMTVSRQRIENGPCPKARWFGQWHRGARAIGTYDVVIGADYRYERADGKETFAEASWHDVADITACDACGYAFTDRAEAVGSSQVPYRRVDQVAPFFDLQDAPVGALFDAFWLGRDGRRRERGPGDENRMLCWAGDDGICLGVVVPANPDGSGTAQWIADGWSLGGGGWTRTGDPRKPSTLTVSPSIFISAPTGFHGWLRDGMITSV